MPSAGVSDNGKDVAAETTFSYPVTININVGWGRVIGDVGGVLWLGNFLITRMPTR